MCKFVDVMEQLKSSSITSVANEEFTDFNEYMHIESSMDSHLEMVIKLAATQNKSLVLVCGNSGDGKSHLIARLKSVGVFSDETFSVYIDATSADKKGMKANEKLKEKLMPFSDSNINDGKGNRLIVAINLGILNDFLKNYENEFSIVKKYVDSQGLFDVVPAWKYEDIKDNFIKEPCFIGHVDFTSFHRYKISPDGLNTSFIDGLFERVVSKDSRNIMRETYDNVCESCTKRSNCPVYSNFKRAINDTTFRSYAIDLLSRAIIKHNIAPSVRDINNFFYDLIIGRTFDEALITSTSIQRLTHFINNLSLTLLFEGTDGLLALVGEQDVLNHPDRQSDKKLIELNLKPSFDKWLNSDALKVADEFKQISTDIKYCQSKNAKDYRQEESRIKRSIFHYYIRLLDSQSNYSDTKFSEFLNYLYFYNVGNEQKCKELISLIKDCIYVWNGKLGDSSGGIVRNGVISGKGTERYFLYKKIDVTFKLNKNINPLESGGEYENFASTLRFNFMLKDGTQTIPLDVDYQLFELLCLIRNGYVPTENDRKKNVNFDSFVRTLLAETNSDTYIYSRYDNGRTYRISKDEFESFTFENED